MTELKTKETFVCWARKKKDCCGLELPITEKSRYMPRRCIKCHKRYHCKIVTDHRKRNPQTVKRATNRRKYRYHNDKKYRQPCLTWGKKYRVRKQQKCVQYNILQILKKKKQKNQYHKKNIKKMINIDQLKK
eukprot:250384_1